MVSASCVAGRRLVESVGRGDGGLSGGVMSAATVLKALVLQVLSQSRYGLGSVEALDGRYWFPV